MVRDILLSNFQHAYDCLFSIIRKRFTQVQQSQQRILLEEQAGADATPEQMIAAFASITAQRCLTVEDYLYLPSNISRNRRAEIERKFGSQAKKIDQEYENFVEKVSRDIML